jgi:hypothetical protein
MAPRSTLTPGLWLLQWLLSARAFLAVDADAGLESARARIQDRDFWVLQDPERPNLTSSEARRAGAIGYRVAIEVGLEAELPSFVRTVGAVLHDPRGWANSRLLVPVASGERFTILLARPDTIDRLCRPLRTKGQYSCGRAGRASLNLARWQGGAMTWGEDVSGYRVYMINHEVGHLLGIPHANCEAPGEPAPVMQQQSMKLDGCTPHGWPNASELARLGKR